MMKCREGALRIGVKNANTAIYINAPYEFLGLKEGVDVIDYVAMKECFDKRNENDKFEDKILEPFHPN